MIQTTSANIIYEENKVVLSLSCFLTDVISSYQLLTKSQHIFMHLVGSKSKV